MLILKLPHVLLTLLVNDVLSTEFDEKDSDCGCSITSTGNRDVIIENLDAIHKIESSDLLQQEIEIINLKGGLSMVGTNSPLIGIDGESPARKIRLNEFFLDKFEVSNAQFLHFIHDTGYLTENEKYGWSFVFLYAASRNIASAASQAVAEAPWWIPVDKTDWIHPEGPDSNVFKSNRSNHPVVQVSWNDAYAYCAWRGGRLPTEAEWEYAARGPQDSSYFNRGGYIFPWGDVFVQNRTFRANIWQGEFPTDNSMEDGYHFTAPIDAYGPQNSFGFHNLIGNAWEWTDDWWYVDKQAEMLHTEKTKKGGSFLCHKKWCYRYRVAARTGTSPDSASGNCGFRCAHDANNIFSSDRAVFNGSHYVISRTDKLKMVLLDDSGNPLFAAGDQGGKEDDDFAFM